MTPTVSRAAAIRLVTLIRAGSLVDDWATMTNAGRIDFRAAVVSYLEGTMDDNQIADAVGRIELLVENTPGLAKPYSNFLKPAREAFRNGIEDILSSYKPVGVDPSVGSVFRDAYSVEAEKGRIE